MLITRLSVETSQFPVEPSQQRLESSQICVEPGQMCVKPAHASKPPIGIWSKVVSTGRDIKPLIRNLVKVAYHWLTVVNLINET